MSPEILNKINFRCLNYTCQYSYTIVGPRKKIYYGNYEHEACFSRLYGQVGRLSNKATKIRGAVLRIKVFEDPEANTHFRWNNWTPLKRSEIEEYLDELTRMFNEAPGESKLTYELHDKVLKDRTTYSNKEPKSINYVEVHIKVWNIYAYWLKWIAAYVRYMTETPCNLCLAETFTLREKFPELREFPILSVFMLPWTTAVSCAHALSVYQTTGIWKPISWDKLVKSINTAKTNSTYVDNYFKTTFKVVNAEYLAFDYFKRPLQSKVNEGHWTSNTEMIKQVILPRTLRESDEAMYREMFRIVGLEIK